MFLDMILIIAASMVPPPQSSRRKLSFCFSLKSLPCALPSLRTWKVLKMGSEPSSMCLMPASLAHDFIISLLISSQMAGTDSTQNMSSLLTSSRTAAFCMLLMKWSEWRITASSDFRISTAKGNVDLPSAEGILMVIFFSP